MGKTVGIYWTGYSSTPRTERMEEARVEVDASAKDKDASVLRETREELLLRHQKEKKELQNKEVALKKAAAKGSKAEQKTKKKQVEEEIAKLESKMQARQAKELASLQEHGDEDSGGLEGVTKAMNGILTLGVGTSQLQKPTKAQKRRDKRAQLEAEREQRIQEEQCNVVSSRVLENEQLEKKLRPLGLTLKEMKSDGHCLYRAVEDQLALYPHVCQPSSFQGLREMAAAYMRAYPQDFVPFIATEDGENGEESQEARFESYCQEVESTASWGGQLELDAIARALKKHIVVYSSNLPEVEMGKVYETKGDGARDPTLRLSYHLHAFGLGEHYNSVVPSATGP